MLSNLYQNVSVTFSQSRAGSPSTFAVGSVFIELTMTSLMNWRLIFVEEFNNRDPTSQEKAKCSSVKGPPSTQLPASLSKFKMFSSLKASTTGPPPYSNGTPPLNTE